MQIISHGTCSVIRLLKWRQSRRVVHGVLCFLLCTTLAVAQTPSDGRPSDDTTVTSGSHAGGSALELRRAEEGMAERSRFAITPYKQNYILPVSYNWRTNKRFESLDPMEMKFQISLKITLFKDFLGSGGILSFGYTQQSYWQAFNQGLSSPFRETNYEPELMWGFWRPRDRGPLSSRGIVLGAVHQSNGRNLPQSRSWNRVYVNFIFEYEEFYFSLRPWFRIPEDRKSSQTDPVGDDNPDIEDYLGYGDVMVLWVRGDHRFGLMLRNNLDSDDNRGAVQVDWSFPIRKRFLGYIQYFNGYGESLIDYNHSVSRLGIGFMVNNWL